jgi:hypothetical protein
VRPLGSDQAEKTPRSKTGTTELKHFILRKLGHALVVIPYWEWDAVVGMNGDAMRDYLRRKLNLHLDDVEPELVQRAAAAIGAFTRGDYLKAERSGRLADALACLQERERERARESASEEQASVVTASESSQRQGGGQAAAAEWNWSSVATDSGERETTVVAVGGTETCGRAKQTPHDEYDCTDEELHTVCRALGLFTRQAFELAEASGTVKHALTDLRRQRAEATSGKHEGRDRNSGWERRSRAEPLDSSISATIRSVGAMTHSARTARAERQNGAGAGGKPCPRGRANVNAFAALERQESECF